MVALGVFIFPNAIPRLLESCRDFGTSCAYYFSELFFEEHNISSTVITMPSWTWAISRFQPLRILPLDWGQFKKGFGTYWRLFIKWDNLKIYFLGLLLVVAFLAQFLLIIAPVVLVLYFVFNRQLNKQNNDYDKESSCLKIWKRVSSVVYYPIKKWLSDYIVFLKENALWYKLWFYAFALYFNVITIIVEFFAFLLYFIVSFDFGAIYKQFYKLTLDLTPVVRFIPAFLWVVFGILLLSYLGRKRGYAELDHRERRNIGFLNERGVMTVVYGTMGKGKTKLITDWALSDEVRMRDMAFEIILESDFKFPKMNWATLEQDFKKAVSDHVVFSIPTAEDWVAQRCEKWCDNPVKENIWGYDFERYGETYDDNLKVVHLWDVIKDYVCAYFIYTVQSSLLISNYSIRVDSLLQDVGNFPQWNSDFFHRDSRLIDSFSRHAHILDFDMLRLGKRMVEENPNRWAFGFGVYIISEIDKERKNTPDLKDVKSNAWDCNQKNDLFNALVKMSRHRCVIANRVFVRFYADLQRPESLGADARELGEIVYIEDGGEMSPLLPFYSPFYLFEALFSWLFGKFVGLYYRFRFTRSDKTATMHVLKSTTAFLKKYRDRTCNLFGSSCVMLSVESGRMDGERKDRKYFLQSKKIYAQRYSTDCLSGIFDMYADNNTVGINDLIEYATERGTDEENLLQNSHFQKEIHEYN